MRFWLAGLFALFPLAAQAADFSGTWQAQDTARYVLKLAAKSPLTGRFFVLGKDSAPQDLFAVKTHDRDISFVVAVRANQRNGAFQGTLSADGKTITGKWSNAGTPVTFTRVTTKDAWPTDLTPHKTVFVTVQPGVRLEVLDWGGSGPPMIFLPGLGNTAHVFDGFAPKFTATHHVFGITRRGLGASSSPPATDDNYNADRLGDDVLAVMAALHIERPVLVGHSMGGEELSSIGTRFPERTAGLIYLDAGYDIAYYDPNGNSLTVDVAVIRRDLTELPYAGVSPIRSRALIAELQEMLPHLQNSLADYRKKLEGLPEYPPVLQYPPRAAMDAIDGGGRLYGPIKDVPVLAVFASPPACQPDCDSPSAKAYAETMLRQVDAYAAGNPKARVVRLPFANHYVFLSNAPEVEHEMTSFLAGLK